MRNSFKFSIIQTQGKMNFHHDQLSGLGQSEMEDAGNLFLGFASNDVKHSTKHITEACYPEQDEEDLGGEWRSNVLISSVESRERTPFALRHLTSFQERSMDNHGKRLSETFKQYICWARKIKYIPDELPQSFGLSNLQWDTVEGHIMDQVKLSEHEKKTLVSAARKNTQAQLIISEIIQQIPESYYHAALSIAASLIQQFKKSHLTGQQASQLETQINQTYILMAGKLYERLALLGLASQYTRNHQNYFNFVKSWMEVFYLSLNGYLQNPSERRIPLQLSQSLRDNRFGRKQSKVQ